MNAFSSHHHYKHHGLAGSVNCVRLMGSVTEKQSGDAWWPLVITRLAGDIQRQSLVAQPSGWSEAEESWLFDEGNYSSSQGSALQVPPTYVIPWQRACPHPGDVLQQCNLM